MSGYSFLLVALLSLSACNSHIEGFDNTPYDLYNESQFANGFALIKDNYGKRLDPNHNEQNYADGIMHASVMFGEMDLLDIKKKVIARADNPDLEKDEEGIWRPLYDGVRQSHGHRYDPLYGWVYWLIFNPQADKSKIGSNNDPLTDISITTAMSRADVSYWHNKIYACMTETIPSGEQVSYQTSWMSATEKCQKEYTDAIEKIAAEIYPKLKDLPQYQK